MKYGFLLELAIIILAAKTLGLVMRRIHIPQVVGEIIAGLIIGPNILGIVKPSEFLVTMSELGVILLMFVAGLETDIKEIKKSGVTSLFVAALGVLLPLVGGFLLYGAIYGFAPVGSDKFLEGLFIGTIITATSVGITVEVLREMGKLKTKVGTVILSAAIIDDVIGIVLLAFVSALKNTGSSPLMIVFKTLMFFAFSGLIGFLGYRFFKFYDKRYPHRRRVPIFGLVLCLIMAYLAEHVFGIADITGAFVAGVILCNIKDADYIANKIDVNSYMLFSPIFFAGIGIKTDIRNIDGSMIFFALLFVLVALLCKIIGCGAAAKLSGFKYKDSLRIGIGMMARGEVALIVTQKGLDAGILPSSFFTCVILLIVVSSITTPILMKLLYRGDDKKSDSVPPVDTNSARPAQAAGH